MKRDNYLIEYEDVKESSIQHLLETLENTEGKLLNDLKVKDLTYHNLTEIWPGEGVYIFREDKKVIYVGKARSMSFTERVAKHFDFRHFAWFNRLLELICTKLLELSWNDENAKKASQYAFQNFNLVLLNFKERERIDRTERLLRSCTNPLNKFKKLHVSNLNKIVNKY